MSEPEPTRFSDLIGCLPGALRHAACTFAGPNESHQSKRPEHQPLSRWHPATNSVAYRLFGREKSKPLRISPSHETRTAGLCTPWPVAGRCLKARTPRWLSPDATVKIAGVEGLCFGDFHLARQMKVTRPPGRDPARCREQRRTPRYQEYLEYRISNIEYRISDIGKKYHQPDIGSTASTLPADSGDFLESRVRPAAQGRREGRTPPTVPAPPPACRPRCARPARSAPRAPAAANNAPKSAA